MGVGVGGGEESTIVRHSWRDLEILPFKAMISNFNITKPSRTEKKNVTPLHFSFI